MEAEELVPTPSSPDNDMLLDWSPGPASAQGGALAGSWHDLADLGKPQGFSPEEANKLGRDLYGIPVFNCVELPSERDRNFLLTTKAGTAGAERRYVLKLSNLTETESFLDMQTRALEHLAQHKVPAPETVKSVNGLDVEFIQDANGHRVLMRCVTYIPGKMMADVTHDDEFLSALGEFMGRMDKALETFWHAAANRRLVWDLAHGAHTVRSHLGHISEEPRRKLVERCLERYEAMGGTAAIGRLRKAVVHNDANDHNVVAEESVSFMRKKTSKVSAVIDFGDMVYTELVHNVAIMLAYAMLGKADPLAAAVQVVAGYHGANPLEAAELEALLPLVGLRLCTSCVMAAHSASLDPDNAYLRVTEQPAWDLLQKLDAVDTAHAAGVFRAACATATLSPTATHDSIPLEGTGAGGDGQRSGGSSQEALSRRSSVEPFGRAAVSSAATLAAAANAGPPMSTEEILRLRAKHIASNFSTSYATAPSGPLHMVAGRGSRLYDAEGTMYLDCVNNVSHVGHAHPRVTAAASAQLAQLNTNTRYLSQSLVEYAKELTDTMDEKLEVCFFCCSGSEANDLALRLAKATRKNASDVVVMGSAYHGHTHALIELSPYKFEGKGGEGKPVHVHVIPSPDTLRCRHLNADSEAQTAVPLPKGYLQQVYKRMQAEGAVCVADEVQTGFGRVGSHFWAYQSQGVVPDIVTLGKPMANGLPVAAVVTTAEVARAFHTGMEYFNTFGGTNVSMRVGLEVLRIVREERLQENAAAVGARLLQGLEQLAAVHPFIGEVRGMGLFLGVELVIPGLSGAPPAGALAEFVAARMRERRVLVSTDGPHHNVLKFKPPMCFSLEDAAWFLGALGAVLAVDLDTVTRHRLRQEDLGRGDQYAASLAALRRCSAAPTEQAAGGDMVTVSSAGVTLTWSAVACGLTMGAVTYKLLSWMRQRC